MVLRNSKGQIFLEAVFLMAMVISLLLIFQGLIERHSVEIKKTKLSRETYHEVTKRNTK